MKKPLRTRMGSASLAISALLLAASSCAAAQAATPASYEGAMELDAIMPPFPTEQEDEYLCTSVALPDRPMKLIGVESLAEASTVHHMLLFGCEAPASKEPVWPCRMAPACGSGGENVMYGWGKNAPPVHLPDGAGFSVGPGTATRTVVLQVHYLNKRADNDASGVKLRLTADPVPLAAGLLAYAAGFSVPPRNPSYLVPNECCYSGFEPLYGFAYRVHTHALGRAVTLHHTVAGAAPATEEDDLSPPSSPSSSRRVVKGDPQLPQGFYPIEPTVAIHPGDTLKAVCEFESLGMNATVHAGHTSSDEMCNLYLMLYSEVPFFMWCVDNSEWIHKTGAGGIPRREDARAVPETVQWRPPAKHRHLQGASGEEAARDADVEDSVPVGQIGGVVSGANRTVWGFVRGGRTWTGNIFDGENRIVKRQPIRWPAVLRFDRDTGSVLTSFGAETFFLPHMISVGPDGMLWVADVGLHQVIKLSPDTGEVVLTLGKRLTPSSGEGGFCKPTHAVLGRDGTVFVADGYCNGRIAKFDSKGKYLGEYALPKEPKGPAPLPHSLALDECRDQLYIADREAAIVRSVSLDFKTVGATWHLKHHGLPYALRTGPYGTPLVLTWDRDGTGKTNLVALGTGSNEIASWWTLDGVNSPHDLTVVPAPLQGFGVGDRLLSVIVAETAPEASTMRKFVLKPYHVEDAAAESGGDGGALTSQQQQQRQQQVRDGDEGMASMSDNEDQIEIAHASIGGHMGNYDEEPLPAGLAASHAGHGVKLTRAAGDDGGKDLAADESVQIDAIAARGGGGSDGVAGAREPEGEQQSENGVDEAEETSSSLTASDEGEANQEEVDFEERAKAHFVGTNDRNHDDDDDNDEDERLFDEEVDQEDYGDDTNVELEDLLSAKSGELKVTEEYEEDNDDDNYSGDRLFASRLIWGSGRSRDGEGEGSNADSTLRLIVPIAIVASLAIGVTLVLAQVGNWRQRLRGYRPAEGTRAA